MYFITNKMGLCRIELVIVRESFLLRYSLDYFRLRLTRLNSELLCWKMIAKMVDDCSIQV